MANRSDRLNLSALFAGCLAFFALLALNGCAGSLGGGGAPAASVTGEAPVSEPAGTNTKIAQMSGRPGIGGTGKPNDKSPGIGGTGIVGTVTGFGSILVNGFEVDYAPDLPITFKDRKVRPDALRIGQVVEVEAQGSGNRLRANRLAIRHEVAGPIERIDPARRIAVVFGQRIEIPEGVISADNGSRAMKIGGLGVGDHIDVSGLRRADGVIAASRIDKTGPGAATVLRGRVTATGRTGFSVNGVRIDAPAGSRPRTLASGQDVQIIGTAVGGRLRARRIDQLPLRPFSGRVRRLSVEGFVRRAISGGVAVGRVPITQLPARANLRAGQRIILDGSLDARGRFAAKRLRAPRIDLRRPGRAPANLNTRPTPGRRVIPPAPRPPVQRAPWPRRPDTFRAPPRRPGR